MGNAFFRQNELDLSSILEGSVPILSSILGLLGESSGDVLPRLNNVMEQMDPELMETLTSLISTMMPRRE